MDAITFSAFVDEVSAIRSARLNSPGDYLQTKVASSALFSKTAGILGRAAKSIKRHDLPAVGGVIGGVGGAAAGTAHDGGHERSFNALRGGAAGALALPIGFSALSKHANAWTHGAELAGLGILAKPSFDELRGKHVPEKSKARTELAGLGVLAAPSAVSLARGAMGHAAPATGGIVQRAGQALGGVARRVGGMIR